MDLDVTLIIEVPILFFVVRFFYRNKKLNSKKIIFTGIIASSLTLPYLWFVLSPYILSNYYIYIGEFLVFLFEALVYYHFLELKFSECFFVSFICNFVSLFLGLIIF